MLLLTNIPSKWKILISSCLCIVVMVGCMFFADNILDTPAKIIEPIVIEGYTYNYLNNLQINAASRVIMTVADSRLYIYVRQGHDESKKYEGKLSMFENGKMIAVDNVGMTALAFIGDNMYGYRRGKMESCTIYSYNILTGKEKELLTAMTPRYWHWFFNGSHFNENGSYYLPDRSKPDKSGVITDYVEIKGSEVIHITDYQNSYRLGDRTYSVVLNNYSQTIFCRQDGKEQSKPVDLPEGWKFLIPVEQGLLIYISHYAGGKAQCLYMLTEDLDEPVCLFIDKNNSYASAINMHGNYVYLSIGRVSSDGYSTIGWDPLNGTYRINLDDQSVEKLSKKVYYGLYIFDNSGIYACDNHSNIYRLDFDGNVIGLVLED